MEEGEGVLVLDEAMSSVDAETERVMGMLWRRSLRVGRWWR